MGDLGIPGLPSTPDAITTAITYLLAAVGLSSSAGLRTYLSLLVVGLATHVTAPNGQPYLHLQPDLAALGSPPVLILLGALAIAEFVVDKVPGVDHASDVVHTVLRPVAGALILAAVQNPISDHSQLAAALLGGTLALGVHGLKAGTRATVTATTAGIGNPVVSLIEDVLSVVAMVLLVVAPVLGFLLLVVVLYALWRLLRAIARALFGQRRSTPPAPAVPVGAAVPPVPGARPPSATQANAPTTPQTPPPPAPTFAPTFPALPTPPAPVGGIPPITTTLPLPWQSTWPPSGSNAPTIPSLPSSSAPTWPYQPDTDVFP